MEYHAAAPPQLLVLGPIADRQAVEPGDGVLERVCNPRLVRILGPSRDPLSYAFQAPQRLAPFQADLPANLMEKMIEKDRHVLTPDPHQPP